uniref:Protein-serine/threonine kinase n=1 Tax=Globisporangium ultimum (strain ATCC 200006 / CBS 805.95 / DAOM BR144) TaxID=431595 RepID=K3X8C8_GLOUD
MDEIKELAQNQPTPLSLRQMKTYAAADDKLRLVSASFLHKELQIRFARAIVELSDLPIGLNETASVKKAIDVYSNELKLLKSMNPPSTPEEDLIFTEAIKKAKGRGTNLVPLICGGLNEMKQTDLGNSALKLVSVQDDIKDRLDTFFLSRIGIRMLIGQHVESLGKVGGRVELVDVEATVKSACERASKLCIKYFGQAPEVEISMAAPTAAAPFIYVESHLHHMVFEIVKNSMRATVEYHNGLQHKKPGRLNRLEQVMNGDSKQLGFALPKVEDVHGVTIFPDVRKYRRPGELPPIQIVICQGQEDVTIKVDDEGGGVPRSKWSKLWHYDYTTSPPYPSRDSYGFQSFRQQFSGGGYGLPIARLFARYFGGEVTFISLEGSGSSAFIQAHRLGTKAEVVPGHATFSLQPLST